MYNIYIYANCDHSFPIHIDLEIQVPTVENLALSNVLHLRPGVGENESHVCAPKHFSAINYNHSVLSLHVLIIVFMLSLLVLLML